MKKITNLLITFILILTMTIIPVSASNEISVNVDGVLVDFDVAPRLIGGRTMVPLRAIFEALGAMVQWNEETQTVTAFNEAYIVNATIGSTALTVNGEQKTMDIAPMIIDSRTLVPARFMAEAFNCSVDWDATNMTVYILSSPIDYSQLEKDTNTTITDNSGNYANNSNFNSTPFEKLKNIIIREADEVEDEECNIFYYDDDCTMLISYNSEENENILYYTHEDYRGRYSILIRMLYKMNPEFLFSVYHTTGEEYHWFGEFLKPNKNFLEIQCTFPTYSKEAAYNLLNASFAVMDTVLQIETDMSFSDFGIYYNKN